MTEGSDVEVVEGDDAIEVPPGMESVGPAEGPLAQAPTITKNIPATRAAGKKLRH